MSLAEGTPLGSYRIIAPLGSGGMGEVYRAHDPRLGRDVALKVLPADMAGDPARLERFTREARAIAALNHPHIVTLYSTEEADGIRFITMELVEGQALDAMIPAGGLPLTRFLELALPLADALTAAHLKQITHRDLKPANVMVTNDGRVKVLDFGLARVGGPLPTHQTIEATRPVLTSEGTIVGTIPYMSPEQIEGKALDHRTDLFSLGVMFHEMLTGSRPFSGESSPLLMSAILRDTPSSTSDLRSEVPEPLGRLILRCLEKRPDDRVQTARDIYNELKHVQKQLESGPRRRPDSGAARTAVAESMWIAILPFATRGTDPEAVTLAAGLTEDITTAMARFPSLSVVAPQTANSFKDSALDIRQIAERVGARYIIGGSVRKSSSGTRIAVHLTDADTGAQLWTDMYDFGREERDIYAIQDDVTDRVVATIADKTGVLARALAQTTRDVPLDRLTAREFVYRCWGFTLRPTPAEHAALRAALEAFVARQPDDAELWAELAHLYVAEHALWFNALADPVGRAMRAARRALELDPSNQNGWVNLAWACFFVPDESGLQEAAVRALRLNPRNAHAVAWIGNILTHKGEYDRGAEVTSRAMVLNNSHPGWCHLAMFNRDFARGEFAAALQSARRVNIAEFMWMHLAIAAAAGHLGLRAEGRAAVDALEALAPRFADAGVLREFVSRWYWDEEMVERLLEGVERAKAGSGRGDTAPASRPRSSPSVSPQAALLTPAGATWIAVIPFAAANDAESQSLADGLTEDVTAGLARFPNLSVVAAHSARQHKGSAADVRQIGQALGASYLLDGSIQRAGTTLRVVARLVDASSGAQLWSETYSRELDRSSTLAIQDDVTDRVVATIADVHGVLMRTMSEGVMGRPIESLQPAELRLRYWAYHRQHAPREHGSLRTQFEQLAEAQPAVAPFWNALAHLYLHEYGFGFNPRPEPLRRAREAIGRALELGPLNQHAWEALAFCDFFARDRDGFAHAVDRVLTLNPRNANATALMGTLLVHAGDYERGAALATHAMDINPEHPGWYHFAICNRDYALGDYEGALRAAKRINMPQHLWSHVQIAAAAGQLGRASEAASAIDAVLALAPDFADDAVVREQAYRWKWKDADAERMLDGFRKAMALRKGSPTSSASGSRGFASIAVLPFADLSADRDQAWFCDGIAEEILNALTQLPGLHVAARTSAFSFRDRPDDLRAIADNLGVASVQQGSVRRVGARVRITVQLVDARTGFQHWSDRYDRGLEDIFEVQDDIARAVAGRLKVTLDVTPGSRLVTAQTASIEAYELYLKGRALLLRRGASILPALDQFRRAVELDADYAPAWAGIAETYVVCGYFGLTPGDEVRRQGLAAAKRALALDPQSADGYTALGGLLWICANDRTGSGEAFEQALALNPAHVQARCWYALFYKQSALGRLAEGVEETRKALAIDPLSAYASTILAVALICAGQPDDGVEAARKAVTLDPLSFVAHWALGMGLLFAGRLDEAESVLEEAAAMSGRHHFAIVTLAMRHARNGTPDRARALHAELVARAATGFIPATQLILSADAAGDREEALAYARKALDDREPPFILLTRHWPEFAGLRQDPRFAALLDELEAS
jgi:TolB-like protein/Flp pilus assembly protein TadD